MRKSPLYFKTFIYFSVILLLTAFLISFLFNYVIMNYSEGEISKSAIGKLKVSSNIMDIIRTNAGKNAIKLSLNEAINPDLLKAIPKLGNIGNWDGINKLMNLQTALKDVENANEDLQSIYLYLEDADYMITNYYGSGYVDRFPDTGWMKEYNEKKKNGSGPFWMESRITYNMGKGSQGDSSKIGDNNFVLTYVYPLTSYTTRVKGAIVLNLYEGQISRQINSSDLESEGYIFVMDGKGNTITHVNKELLGKSVANEDYVKDILNSGKTEGNLTINIDGSRQLVTYYKSAPTNWIYVGVFPTDTLMNKVNSLRIGILYALIAIILLAVVVEFVISRLLYNPVRQLLQEIKSKKGFDIQEEKNELTILSRVFDNIIKQESQLHSMLEKNRRNIRDNYCMNLLKGIVPDTDISEVCGISFSYPYYFCIVAIVDRYKVFTESYSEERQYYLKTLILEIFEEVLNQSFQCMGLHAENDKIVLLVNTQIPDYYENVKLVQQYFETIKSEILKILDNTVTISIGNQRDQLQAIRASYYQALDFARLRLIAGHGSVISYREDRFDERKYNYPFNLEKHILNNLNTGSKEGILTSVGEFIHEIKINNELSYDNTVLMLNQLIASTVRYLLDENISINEVFGNDFNIYTQLLENETLDDIGIWLTRIYLDIMEYVKNTGSLNKKYFDAAIEYIHNNYKKDIDVNVLSEKVGISYSQLRRVFLNETGENLVNYINGLRIEEAKRLLKQTNMNIIEIALSLGYYNDRSFNRFFKKYEGITPGEFRKAK